MIPDTYEIRIHPDTLQAAHPISADKGRRADSPRPEKGIKARDRRLCTAPRGVDRKTSREVCAAQG